MVKSVKAKIIFRYCVLCCFIANVSVYLMFANCFCKLLKGPLGNIYS